MWAMTEPTNMSCDDFADVAAELALGVLTGRERAEAIEHLDHCDDCRERVRQLALTQEQLLGMLPGREPPAGFESRVMATFGLAQPPVTDPFGQEPGQEPGQAPSPVPDHVPGLPPRRRVGWTRRMLTAAAVLTAAVIFGAGGWGLRVATSPSGGSDLHSAALVTASHQTVGKIFIYDSKPRWLYMSVDTDQDSQNIKVVCQLVDKNGHVTTIGSFRLVGGYGSWGSPEPDGAGAVTARLKNATTGAILATATFPAQA
jgi:hypothetical protein